MLTLVPRAAVEQVLVDGNKEAEGQDHCDIMSVQPSPDHTILAYAVDTTVHTRGSFCLWRCVSNDV